MGELLVALRYRVRVILAPTIVPPRVALRTICEEQATILCVNPILLRLFAKTQERLQWDLPLRVIYTSGAVADRQLMLDARKVFGKIPVLDIYGLSEAGPRVSAQRIGSSDTPGSVGIPVQEMCIRDRNMVLGWIVNIGRSIPFIILMVALIPFTKFVVGKSIGSTAAIVPLVIAAAPFIARLVETSLQELDAGVIEAAKAMGASLSLIHI